jgi:GTP-binding protein
MTIFFNTAQFVLSAPDRRHCLPDNGLEVAFVGRSNAGKSSALNVLTGERGLAKVSKTPGRTRMINFFSLDEERRLVDLPGYGFAKAPIAVKQQWELTIADYLAHREALVGLVLLTDIRRPLTDNDRQLLNWIRPDLPVHVLVTKADKLKRGKAQNTLLQVRRALKQDYPGATCSMFSALKREGVNEASKVIGGWLGM